jgi:hypothetical protein
VGPEKDFALSENIAIQPYAMGPTPMVEGPSGAADTLSIVGRESNADITPLVSETPGRIIGPNAINQPVGPTALTESAKELDIPQPDSSDAYTNEAAPALLPHPDIGNSWENSTSEFGQTPLLQVFPYDIPQPDSSDAYTNEAAPALLPHSDIGNSWANSTSEFGQTPLLQVFPYDIPQPDSSDAYTNEAAPALLPHPDIGNSWADSTSEFGQTPLLQVFPCDIPQPNSCDAWTTAVAPAPSQLFDANATIHRVDGAASIPLPNSSGDNIPYTGLSDPYGATMNASERSPPHPFGLFPSATT